VEVLYPITGAVRLLIEAAHAASSAAEFESLKERESKAESQFHDAILGVVKSCNRVEAVNQATQLGRFAAAMEHTEEAAVSKMSDDARARCFARPR